MVKTILDDKNLKRIIWVCSNHGNCEGVDVIDVFETVLPWDETLDVDVELIPDGHDGFIILLIPREKNMSSIT